MKSIGGHTQPDVSCPGQDHAGVNGPGGDRVPSGCAVKEQDAARHPENENPGRRLCGSQAFSHIIPYLEQSKAISLQGCDKFFYAVNAARSIQTVKIGARVTLDNGLFYAGPHKQVDGHIVPNGPGAVFFPQAAKNQDIESITGDPFTALLTQPGAFTGRTCTIKTRSGQEYKHVHVCIGRDDPDGEFVSIGIPAAGPDGAVTWHDWDSARAMLDDDIPNAPPLPRVQLSWAQNLFRCFYLTPPRRR